ncbi:MAG TPA: DoxX family membrane protein [Patescibacteria group bacterium]|nr:DoxX family membrane protein [Patescibacteria group bacterium]
MKSVLRTISLTSLFFILSVHFAHAHEAYVLTHSEFQQGLMTFATNPLAPLFDPKYIHTSEVITLCVVALYLLNFLWAATPWASRLDKLIKKAAVIGPLIIRGAISASFFYAAYANAILGPELSLTQIPGGAVIRFLLFVLSVMIFFGFCTELAAVIGLALFFSITFTFGGYMITYANYFGELLVLFLFGSRFFSLDVLLFGKRTLFSFLQKYRSLEIPIVRILYGFALLYAGWSIKFLHQSLSVEVYNQYHLINFFHAPADFIAAGAGLSEMAIGLFILIGFGQRLTTLISLVFITLSILYFREMLWPHFMLYGISFSIIINSADTFTIDRYLVPFIRKVVFGKKGERGRK